MNLFVDTSAFYSLLDADDGNHPAAAAAWEAILAGRDTIRTSNYVLVETTALLQNRIGMEGLREFAADILPVVDIVWIDEGMHRSALHALLVSARRRLSLVDCTSFEAMRSAGITTAFCFDPHFGEQGFAVVPAG